MERVITMDGEQILLVKIEELREQLSKSVNEQGYTSKDTVSISQQLDFLLNNYNELYHPEKAHKH